MKVFSTNLRQIFFAAWTSSSSISLSVYQAPPVISRLGSTSISMYTFLFLFVTHLTDLISALLSRVFRIFAIAGCCRLLRSLMSLVQIPRSLDCSMIWYTSSSSDDKCLSLSSPSL